MITDSEFQRIVTYVKKNYGIDLSQKRVLVGGRLENYEKCGAPMGKVQGYGYQRFADLVRRIFYGRGALYAGHGHSGFSGH